MIAVLLSGYPQIMYPDRENVERLDFDREQDQALPAARGRQEADALAAEERPTEDDETQPETTAEG